MREPAGRTPPLGRGGHPLLGGPLLSLPVVEPEVENLRILRGSDFEASFTIYEDEAKTKPWDFTGWTCTLVAGSVLSLSSGAGLTLTAAAGKVVAGLTGVETEALALTTEHYTLKFVQSPHKRIPVCGRVQIQDP